ncbi:MAG TPA: hypothetical protein VFG69_17115 [Nannocystaceae bacterium]|nr:hypothetical protein [Nannocystaceae bacterium]
MSPALRVGAIALVVALVGYAVWLLVPGDDTKRPAVETEAKKRPRREPPPNVETAGPPIQRPQVNPARLRPAGGSVDPADDPAEAAPPVSPEQARVRLTTLVEDLEARADRGETLSQGEYVALYKQGNALVDPLVRGAAGDPVAQREYGELNSRFRIAINRVQPRAP